MVNLFKGWFAGKKSAKRFTVDYGYGKQPIQPDASVEGLKGYLESDPDLAANVRRFVDNVLIEAPKIIAVPGETVALSTVKSYNEQLKDVRFYKAMRAAVYHLVWHGNAFMEVKFNGKKLKELYNIDPETMEILKSEDGNTVLGYEQRVNGSPIAEFQPEEILHLSIDNLDSGVWGNSFIKSLKATLLRKEIAEYYLQWLIQNDKFSPIISVKGELTEDVWQHIISQINAKAVDPNYMQIINMFPDDKIEMLRIFTTDDFDRIQNYINEQKTQIMTLLQVPPIIAGTVDNSNRSNSEIQARLVFYNTIKAFQNLITEELDFELLRKLDWRRVQFKFPSIDQRVDIDALKIAKTMRADLGFTQEAVQEYLKENGFKIPNVEKMFEEVVDTSPSAENNGVSDDRPSREPRDKSGLVQNEERRLEDTQMGMK